MRAPVALAAAVVLAAGCLDFVDPDALNLAELTRIVVSMELTDATLSCGEATMPAPLEEPWAELCVQGLFDPGRDRFGAPRAVVNDTLVARGVPLAPELDERGVRRFAAWFRLPLRGLDTGVVTLELPRAVAVPVPVTAFAWGAIAPVGPDTLERRWGEPITVRLAPPAAADRPVPTSQSWQASLAGGTSISYNGAGVPPRTAYVFPVAAIDSLEPPLRAQFRWRRQYLAGSVAPDMQLSISLVQELDWPVAPPDSIEAKNR